MLRAAIALGSNVGDRDAHLRYAVSRLQGVLAGFRVSRFLSTTFVGAPGQPPVLNAAVAGDTALDARSLLSELLAIERDRLRERPFPNAPRTLDVDLILLGEVVCNDPDLVVPHPRFRERAFVLEPLVEIAPEMVDPVTGLTVRELWKRLRQD